MSAAPYVLTPAERELVAPDVLEWQQLQAAANRAAGTVMRMLALRLGCDPQQIRFDPATFAVTVAESAPVAEPEPEPPPS